MVRSGTIADSNAPMSQFGLPFGRPLSASSRLRIGEFAQVAGSPAPDAALPLLRSMVNTSALTPPNSAGLFSFGSPAGTPAQVPVGLNSRLLLAAAGSVNGLPAPLPPAPAELPEIVSLVSVTLPALPVNLLTRFAIAPPFAAALLPLNVVLEMASGAKLSPASL